MTDTAARAAPPHARNPLRRAQVVIGVALVLLTAGAWTMLVQQQAEADHSASMTPTMGLGAPLFLGLWLAMVAAMMFPAVAPTILMFARVSANRRSSGRPLAPTASFVAGYLVVWTAIGVAAFALGTAAEQVADRVDVIGNHAGRIGAVLVIAAGAYQFSALKERCMTECRSPLAFLTQHWREGPRGALAMGIHHGLVCAGCCWALMAILVPLGMMNIVALGAVTVVIFAERVLPGGKIVQYGAGIALLGYGVAALVGPDTMMQMGGH